LADFCQKYANFNIISAKTVGIDGSNPSVNPFRAINRYILPKLMAMPALKANKIALNNPLTFSFPPGVLI
jgi:hypothetical protein